MGNLPWGERGERIPRLRVRHLRFSSHLPGWQDGRPLFFSTGTPWSLDPRRTTSQTAASDAENVLPADRLVLVRLPRLGEREHSADDLGGAHPRRSAVRPPPAAPGSPSCPTSEYL